MEFHGIPCILVNMLPHSIVLCLCIPEVNLRERENKIKLKVVWFDLGFNQTVSTRQQKKDTCFLLGDIMPLLYF